MVLPAPSSVPHDDIVLDCQIKDLHYGSFKAVRDTAIPIKSHIRPRRR